MQNRAGSGGKKTIPEKSRILTRKLHYGRIRQGNMKSDSSISAKPKLVQTLTIETPREEHVASSCRVRKTQIEIMTTEPAKRKK